MPVLPTTPYNTDVNLYLRGSMVVPTLDDVIGPLKNKNENYLVLC